MSRSEVPEPGKADSGRTPTQADAGNTSATPVGPGPTTDIAANSSSNANTSQQQWTTIPTRRAPATRGGRGSGGRGSGGRGSAARGYYNPANRGSNPSHRGTWNNGVRGRAPAWPTTPGTTAPASGCWVNRPPRGAPAAFTTPHSTAQAYRERRDPPYTPTQPTAPDFTARAWNSFSSVVVPPTAPAYQSSTAIPPSNGGKNLDEFVTVGVRALTLTQTVATGEPSDGPRTPVAAEATPEVFHNSSTTGAATEPVVERATVGEPTNERAKSTTGWQPETDIGFPGNVQRSMNPLMVSLL